MLMVAAKKITTAGDSNMINAGLQWLGTLALITMYVIMSFYPEAYPLNIVMGLLGGSFYLAWSIRTHNRPQVIVNSAGILVCVLGLYRAWA
jgi:hypothetical protein